MPAKSNSNPNVHPQQILVERALAENGAVCSAKASQRTVTFNLSESALSWLHARGHLSDIAWRVICVGESVPAAEREMSWPVRSGKLVLKIALDRLAVFYRIPG